MKRYLILLILLIPGLCFGAEAVKTAGGVADSAVKSISGKASADIKTMCGVGYNDGDAGCSASYGSELATSANATDDAGGNEANATTGWTGTTCNPFGTTATAQTGSYALAGTADGGSADNFNRALTGDAGTVYKISFYQRHNGTAANNGEWKCGITPSSSAPSANIPFATLTKADTTYAIQTVYFLVNANTDVFRCGEYNTDNDGGIYLDNFSFKSASLCYGNELYTTSNALGTADANATTGITDGGLGTFEVASSGCADGSYCIHAVANSANDAFYIDLSGILTDGKKYMIRWKTKHSGSGDAAACGFESTTTFTPGSSDTYVALAATDTSWIQNGVSITYSSSYRYFGCVENGSSNNSDFYIDTLTIKEITGE